MGANCEIAWNSNLFFLSVIWIRGFFLVQYLSLVEISSMFPLIQHFFHLFFFFHRYVKHEVYTQELFCIWYFSGFCTNYRS